MIKGIDISEFNGFIDFNKVRDSGINFVMIRATYGRKKEDKLLHKNVKACIEAGIPFGFYYYSYAIDEETAREEVDFFLKTVGKYREYVSYPLAIDMEDSDGYKKERNAISKENLTNICDIACKRIRDNSFIPMIYANADYFKNYLDEEKLKDYPKWIAWWSQNANIDKTKYSIWQYKSTGIVDGIGTKVDMNECFFDYQKYTNYLNNVIKINEIKLLTGLQDITIQYISCNKDGQEILNKIYYRLKEKKQKRKDISEFDLLLKITKEFKFTEEEIEYFKYYIYYNDLLQKLYNGITEGEK